MTESRRDSMWALWPPAWLGRQGPTQEPVTTPRGPRVPRTHRAPPFLPLACFHHDGSLGTCGRPGPPAEIQPHGGLRETQLALAVAAPSGVPASRTRAG